MNRQPTLVAWICLLALAWTMPSGAQQLDETCVASAFNRSAPVQPNGVWVLPNVPANIGRVRVRATCVDENGVVRSGQSDFFVVPPNGVIEVADIVFDAPALIPSTLALSAPMSLLTSAGHTLQITATARFPDGTSADVSTAAAGTTYTVSNSAFATVDADGLVTALASGTVLVTAMHDGTTGFLRLDVLLDGDSDGDGLPDDFELANGLDPNDPADALADPDADGLTNLEEFQAGLGLFDADSDDDGLDDGDEVNRFGTDPLVADTDGDRVSDGLEVLAGSDPLDPLSVNLGPILASMTVTPEAFTLVFNTALGEAARLLEVTGTLIDDTELDITGGPYGTTYRSSDLTVAGFGAVPGQVFAGQDGVAAITAENGAFAAEAVVAVQTFMPTALGFVRIPGAAHAVALADGSALVAAGSADLQVVDIVDPTAPTIIGAVSFPGDAFDVVAQDGLAYVAAGNGGLVIVDVTAPASPRVLGSAPTPGSAVDVAIEQAVDGPRIHVVDRLRLRIFDAAEPNAPTLLGELSLPGNPRGVDVRDGLAVVALELEGVAVIDVADPSSPTLLGTTPTRSNGRSSAADVTVRNRLAYVADGARSLGGVAVVDFSIADTPVVVSSTSTRVGLNDIAVEGALIFGADYLFFNGVPIFDAGALPPTFREVLDFRGAFSNFRDDNGFGVAVRDGLVYLAGNRCCTQGFPVTGDSTLHIGRYALIVDDLGRAPTVSLTAPADGDVFRERRLFSLRADAVDDVLVQSVAFRVDGQIVATDFSAPYEQRFDVREGPVQVVVDAVATDLGGNQAVSEAVTIDILADASPSVRILAPQGGSDVIEGERIRISAEATDDSAVSRVAFSVDGVERAVDMFRPYRFFFDAPPGPASFTVTATVTDDVGQTAASEPVTIGVLDDRPPFVAVLVPAAGGDVVEGASLRIEAGADDDFTVREVRFFADGTLVATDRTVPYAHALRIEAPVGSAVRIGATAIDSRGQASASEDVILTVAADPGTTVIGRVVGLDGVAIFGAAVDCLGHPAVSGGNGAFSVVGVPTAFGSVTCNAAFTGAGGEVIAGTSGPVPPQVGGITEIGEIRLAPQLLYAGSGTRFGEDIRAQLSVFDRDAGRLIPWSPPLELLGLTGLAFDAAGTLFGATGGGSELVRLDPDSGEVLQAIRPIAVPDPLGGPGVRISVEDMTYDPVSERLVVLERDGFSSGTLSVVDPATGEATRLSSPVQFESAAISFGPGGLLYVLGIESFIGELSRSGGESGAKKVGAKNVSGPGELFLAVLDPVTGEVLAGLTVLGDVFFVGGMAYLPGSDTFVVASAGALFEMTSTSLTLVPIASDLGVDLQSLALRPLDRPPTTTHVIGMVQDENGVPVAGAAAVTLGGMAFTNADGRFTIADLEVRTDRLRVAVSCGAEQVVSSAVSPVAGGVTDFGPLELPVQACSQAP